MGFHPFWLVIAFLFLTYASPIPDLVFDEVSNLCLNRREESMATDYSGMPPEDSIFKDSVPETLTYGLSEPYIDSGLSNEGLGSDSGFIPYDVAALPLDTNPTDSRSPQRKSCPANPDLLPDGFQIFNTMPPNPFIPSCEAAEHTLCCAGIPEPSPEGSGNLGPESLALPNLEKADGLVNVKECIICTFSRRAFVICTSSLANLGNFSVDICQSPQTTFCCRYKLVSSSMLTRTMQKGVWATSPTNHTIDRATKDSDVDRTLRRFCLWQVSLKNPAKKFLNVLLY